MMFYTPVSIWLIESFQVKSYQANFASHRTHDCQICFLTPQSGTEKHNKMAQNFHNSSYHNTKLQLNDKNIRPRTCVKFKIL